MVSPTRDNAVGPRVRVDDALRLILEGTVDQTGQGFFRALVRNVAAALRTDGAWVTEYLPDRQRLRSLAFWFKGAYIEHYEYDIRNTPCQPVIEQRCLAHFADRLLELFPLDSDLTGDAVSYIGVPLLDADGQVIGHLGAIDSRPMPAEPGLVEVFELFAARAAAEQQRLRADAAVRAREQQLQRLLDSAMDAIVVLDAELTIRRANPAACRLLADDNLELIGRNLRGFLSAASRKQLRQLLDAEGESGAASQWWLPQSLEACRADGRRFPAEATLSRFESDGSLYYTLILRNIDERLAAERRIRDLTQEAEYLREAVGERGPGDAILGRSAAIAQLREAVARVAPTDASVLLLGETGTGKELAARAIHHASRRADGPFIAVNCAAIPANLIESEFFGHEKGAFTGATTRRDGRFALADGGTLFLDEIGELPLDLQAKLLRVLQEGEFEPVGAARTRRVDVRVVAATNRDLKAMADQGAFREDLYYRLSVFPIQLPALRRRGDDVVLLAEAFAQRFAARMGRQVEPLTGHDQQLLRRYDWPGNVRELQNVIERALILSTSPRLDLTRAMPTAAATNVAADMAQTTAAHAPVLTAEQMQQFERDNLCRAMEASGWKIAGPDGAAARLGLKPSTLTSRLKALNITRPRG